MASYIALAAAVVLPLVAAEDVQLCGHEPNASSDCKPVNPGELFIAIAPFTFFPFLILWGISCYCCLKENDIDLREYVPDAIRRHNRHGAPGVLNTNMPVITRPMATPGSTAPLYQNAILTTPAYNSPDAVNVNVAPALGIPSRRTASGSVNANVNNRASRSNSSGGGVPAPPAPGRSASPRQKQSPGAARTASAAPGAWKCANCTFENQHYAPACDMCGAAKV